MQDVAANLAQNLVQLREIRGWTQQKLADFSGVPRPTVGTLESGSANPTLVVLAKVADALQVSLDELIGPPRAVTRLYRPTELKTRRRGAVEVRELLPDPLPSVTVERMAFAPGATLTGVPHTSGTREYLTCERGGVALTVAGERHEVGPGEVLVFRGDQRHSYQALGETEAVAYSVVMPVRSPSVAQRAAGSGRSKA